MKRIAVVGSGISGMAAAYLLSRHAHVTLYEKNPVAGGHARTLVIDYDGKAIPVDTGFIVFNHPTYPNLLGLFAQMDVATEKSDMSFSFTMDGGRFEWGAQNLNAVFATRKNIFSLSFYRLLLDVARFFRTSETVIANRPELSLAGLVNHMKLGHGFRDRFLLPMGAAIWSCPAEQMLDFPAASLVRFFRNHGLLSFSGQHQWYTVTGGSQEYVKKILAPVQEIRLASPVTRIDTSGTHPRVISGDGEAQLYDAVVIAAHADEALAMIDSPSHAECEVLGAFRYQKNIAYLHRDVTMMPKRKSCWASWNYHADSKEDVAVTYWMNRLQNIDVRYPLFVTLNPAQPIAEDKRFNVHTFTHPVFTNAAVAAQARIPEIQGARGLWFCGAYQRNGFHEDGLWSAVRVAQTMGVPIPWL